MSNTVHMSILKLDKVYAIDFEIDSVGIVKDTYDVWNKMYIDKDDNLFKVLTAGDHKNLVNYTVLYERNPPIKLIAGDSISNIILDTTVNIITEAFTFSIEPCTPFYLYDNVNSNWKKYTDAKLLIAPNEKMESMIFNTLDTGVADIESTHKVILGYPATYVNDVVRLQRNGPGILKTTP